MKRLILLITLLFVFACGPTYQLYNDYNMYYTREQVDSVCMVERIPKNLNKWVPISMSDDSTAFKQYTYIKSTDSTHFIWTLTDLDSLYKFKRKILKITDK